MAEQSEAEREQDVGREPNVLIAIEPAQQTRDQRHHEHRQADQQDGPEVARKQAVVDQDLGQQGLEQHQSGARQGDQHDQREPAAMRSHEAEQPA
jgi:hypothetical protein